MKRKIRWWEWPIIAIAGPPMLGMLWYFDWSGKRWNARRLKEQEQWANGDRTRWQR